MKAWRLTGVAVLLAAAASSASAYTVKGSITCPNVIEEDANENFRDMNKWWLLGYFTARNYNDALDVGLDIDDDNLYQMALGYCQGHPDNDWDDAAIHVYDMLD